MPKVAQLLPFSLATAMVASAPASACTTGQASEAQVEQVYPSADYLPENLLRFYIYFSEPMARDDIWDTVVLLDAEGTEMPGVFIENKFDLWSPDDRRLTVLFDPGRVKTGLVAHNTLGRALQEGETYTLRVDQSAQTRRGCALTSGFDKTFTATAEDFTAPDLSSWQVNRPAAGTTDPLRIDLQSPADHLSLAYRIRVADAGGNRLRGALQLENDEQTWVFTPEYPWSDAAHSIEVDTTLEDIAGNRLSGLFDRPLAKDGNSAPAPDTEILTFTPR